MYVTIIEQIPLMNRASIPLSAIFILDYNYILIIYISSAVFFLTWKQTFLLNWPSKFFLAF